MRWPLLIALPALLLLASPALKAEDLPEQAFRAVIAHQLGAMAQDDNAGAYADAAPNVQAIFPNPEIFMSMVRQGYQPVYRNKSYKFIGAGTDANGRAFEKVAIEGADGQHYQAMYFMEQQSDGSWKISGCVILKEQDAV